ncbi:hypothetical protein [Myxosarcina sp. GI1]|uniref:hypothetical protein n=1 Tax=Myxosarcina sp. GI1 TaxID=1541065 RepID=UPI00056AEF8A|nr:hypothetical protein [Myxosarcina sp. GI1]
MIHHLSIPAKNPFHVAKVLTELFDNSYCAPFPSYSGSYVAFAGDKYGTVIEVYPLGTEMLPGKDDKPIQFRHQDTSNPFIATHAAISIPIEREQVEAIAKREQWRCVRCDRGYFEIIEFWIENAVLLELSTPDLAGQYIDALSPDKLAEYFTKANS